ncbi:hypothetical protein PoB_006834500 [Plakobranchus ocellatus]|uniref:Uncharacterized protein n=1 Tax=Plakobranchus ocellatus TaxID=259542 RepID=A0AAV4DCS4_9GAST|nr:hypothetical protein PoB_006834500 [Plakobranchus ocellatus]
MYNVDYKNQDFFFPHPHAQGFSRYSGFLHLECYHTHPCMQTFVLVLAQCRRDTQNKLLGSNSVKADVKTPDNLFSMALVFLGLRKVAKPKNKVSDSALIDENNKSLEQKDLMFIRRDNTWNVGESKAMELVTKNNAKTQITPKIISNDKLTMQTATEGENDQNVKMSEVLSNCAEDSIVEIPVSESVAADSWMELRESDSMKTHRRRQRAAFMWFLMYTLHYNPQLTIERKNFLQRKRCLRGKNPRPGVSEDSEKKIEKVKSTSSDS